MGSYNREEELDNALKRLDELTSALREHKSSPNLIEVGESCQFCSLTPHLHSLTPTEGQCVPKNWAMCVPPVFYPALNIEFSEEKSKKQGRPVYVQGSAFSFEVGHTLYDSMACYARCCLPIRKPEKLAVQIISATPAIPSKPTYSHFFDKKPSDTEINQYLMESQPPARSPKINKVKENGEQKYKIVAYTKRLPGTVSVSFYRPTENEGWVELFDKADLTQDQFVRSLIIGFDLH
ncbi:MAG: hypothetical protein ACQERT_05330 [Thermodesulfobacteriota bacterium]